MNQENIKYYYQNNICQMYPFSGFGQRFALAQTRSNVLALFEDNSLAPYLKANITEGQVTLCVGGRHIRILFLDTQCIA